MPRSLEVLVTCFRSEDRFVLARILARCGLKPVLSSSVEKSRGLLSRRPVRLAFCDDELPDGSVGQLLEEIEKTGSRVPVVVISRLENWDEYLRAMRLGAFDYISTPIRRAEVERVVTKALEDTPTPPSPPPPDPDGDSGSSSEANGREEKKEPEDNEPGSHREPRSQGALHRRRRAPRGRVRKANSRLRTARLLASETEPG